jgi:hypothetical protein
MLEELRLNPRSLAARSCGRRPGENAGTDVGLVDPSLSTGFADPPWLRSTGASDPLHTMWRGLEKEEG